MIGTRRFFVANGLLALVMTLGGTSCRMASHFPESATPAGVDRGRGDPKHGESFDLVEEDYGEFFDVQHVVLDGEQRLSQRVGQVYRQVRGDHEVHWVRNLRLREVGFILDGIAFRVDETVLPGGSSRLEQTPLGDYGLTGGVQRLLNLEGGTVVLEKVTARNRAP